MNYRQLFIQASQQANEVVAVVVVFIIITIL